MMPKMEVIKTFGRTLLLLAVLWLGYTAALALVYCIPDEMIREHQESGLALIEAEGTYPEPVFDTHDAKLDNFTDAWMLRITEESSAANALQRAMVPTYARYWHGYLLYLRPLLLLVEFRHIRSFLHILFMLLFALCFSALDRTLDRWTAMGFTLAMILVRFSVISVSMQFASCFFVMMLAILCLSSKKLAGGGNNRSVPIVFAVAGSLVNFLDLLTAPAVTLGVPLLIYLGILDKRRESIKYKWQCVMVCSLHWLYGYAATWLAKWGIGSVILHENLFLNAFGQAAYRSSGSPADRLGAVHLNFISSRWQELAMVAFGLLIILMAICLAARAGFSHMLRTCKALLPELTVAFYPYLWFVALAQQTEQHNFYTYRAQMITVLAQCMILHRLISRFPRTKASPKTV